jgi:hypothetical protein
MIILVEPQCRGFEHAEVNTALLKTYQTAFPNDDIWFLGEIVHINYVKQISYEQKCAGINFKEVSIPILENSKLKRLKSEWKFVKNVFSFSKKIKCKNILFASITNPGLFCIKFFTLLNKEIKVIVIPHTILESITHEISFYPKFSIPWFRFNLLILNSPNLIYLLYGEINGIELAKILPSIRHQIKAIDLPYFFNKKAQNIIHSNDNILRIGYFGVVHSGKGADKIFEIAKQVNTKLGNQSPEFVMIGKVSDLEISNLSANILFPSPHTPLDKEDFENYANKLDYSIFCFSQKSYRLTVSASFYDAIAFIKPIIALRTPFFEYYFNKLGDIGYLCENYKEIEDLIIELNQHKISNRYKQQCKNIQEKRHLLDIENISVKMYNHFK